MGALHFTLKEELKEHLTDINIIDSGVGLLHGRGGGVAKQLVPFLEIQRK